MSIFGSNLDGHFEKVPDSEHEVGEIDVNEYVAVILIKDTGTEYIADMHLPESYRLKIKMVELLTQLVDGIKRDMIGDIVGRVLDDIIKTDEAKADAEAAKE
jgi:hypothetical protein